MLIHYAVQTCDISFNTVNKRYCSDSKSEVTKKCVTSFLLSVQNASKVNVDVKHEVVIYDDHSTEDTLSYLIKLTEHFSGENLSVKLVQLETKGIMNSIRACYESMKNSGADLVYQVQDDYMFEPNAIHDMIGIFFQIYHDTKTECVVQSYNCPKWWLWPNNYRYKSVPRAFIIGFNGYWLQTYDTSCSFLTSLNQFNNIWNLCEEFLSNSPTDPQLEANSLNRMFTEMNLIGVLPVQSVALHMQHEDDKDPFIDWETKWNSIEYV